MILFVLIVPSMLWAQEVEAPFFLPQPFKLVTCPGFDEKCVLYTPDDYRLLRKIDVRAHYMEQINFQIEEQKKMLETQIETMNKELVAIHMNISLITKEMQQLQSDYKKQMEAVIEFQKECSWFWDALPWLLTSFVVGVVSGVSIGLVVD